MPHDTWQWAVEDLQTVGCCIFERPGTRSRELSIRSYFYGGMRKRVGRKIALRRYGECFFVVAYDDGDNPAALLDELIRAYNRPDF